MESMKVQYLRGFSGSYQDTVKAQFFSHTHRDEVLLSKDERNRAFSVQYVAPSLTPFTNKNPGYKMYTIDGARGSDSTWVRELR